jgi:putative hemolysin
VVSLVSFLSIVFGELVPKSIALRASERYALLVGPPLLSLSRVAKPIVWLLTAASNLVLRPLHDRTTFIEARMSAEELRQMVEDVSNAGALDARAGEIASRAIALSELRAVAVMVPRHTIVWMPDDATLEQVRRILREHPHSRYPVARDGENDVSGYVLARDVYEQLLDGALNLAAAMRKLPFFPERTPAVDVLRQLQAARSKIGLVVDDYGAVAGLVSVKDIAEELLGELLTEYDRPESNIHTESDDSFVVRGTTPVHQLNRDLDLDLPTSPDWSTLAGLVMAAAGRIPERNERITLPGGIEVEVLDATARGVRQLRLHKPRASKP